MSIFNQATAKCGACGNEAPVKLAASVNADRRPDLRLAIIDGSFQAETCAKCGGRMRLPANLTYMDTGRGQWILADDVRALPDWQAAEAHARGLFESTFGAAAPDEAREIGAGLQPRLVFGWPALREKLIAADLSVQDLSLELLKLQIIRDVPNPPLADQTELRLVGGDDTTLRFGWIVSATEAPLNSLSVPRKVYRDIDEQPEDYYELREKFDDALFVDLRRLVFA